MKSALTTCMLVVFALAGLGSFTGCEAQRKIDELTTANRKLQERVVELQSQVSELNERIRLLQQTGSDATQTVSELMTERDRLQAELDQLRNENVQLRSENERLAARGPRLPVEVENALKDFAMQHPGLATFDPVTQAVKFDADLTFGLGSAELSTNARRAIRQLAEIFNSESARRYEVRVVGHTDSVPISRPSTKQNHPTNWHLSVHRAIAVRDALSEAGIADVRTAVSGYSKYRPVVQNARRGAQPNRRVEVYLKPMGQVNESLIPRAGMGDDSATNAEPEAPEAPAAYK